MAIYTTGRTRTLVVEGTLKGVLHLYIGEAGMWGPDGPLPPPPGTISYRAQAYATITTAWGASVSAFPAPDDPITPTGKDLGTKVTADAGFGDTDEDVNAANYPSPPYDFTGSIDGEYTFSVEVEECVEITDGGLGTWPSSEERPSRTHLKAPPCVSSSEAALGGARPRPSARAARRLRQPALSAARWRSAT